MTLINAQPANYGTSDFDSQFAHDESNREWDWVGGLCRGDERSYVRLIHTYTGKLLTVARRYLSEDDAQDAVQEAFIKTFESIDTFQRHSTLSTWLHRIVINCCLEKLRKSKIDKEVSIDSLLPSFLEDGHRANPTGDWPEDCLEQLNTRSLVTRSIDQIPQDYRLVILLRDIEGLSGKETATVLGISINLVKVRLHRARQALREQLDPLVHGELHGKQ